MVTQKYSIQVHQHQHRCVDVGQVVDGCGQEELATPHVRPERCPVLTRHVGVPARDVDRPRIEHVLEGVTVLVDADRLEDDRRCESFGCRRESVDPSW